jgi:hypothetical protein
MDGSRFRLPRFVAASLVATLLAAPTWLAAAWGLGSAGDALLVAVNIPGIFVMWSTECLPPDGYPGDCPGRALVSLVTQVAVWYALLSFPGLIGLGRKRGPDRGSTR